MSLSICLLIIIAGLFIWSFIDRYNNRFHVRKFKAIIEAQNLTIKIINKELEEQIGIASMASFLVKHMVVNHQYLKRFDEIEGIEITNSETGITYILSHFEGELSIQTGVPWGNVPESIKYVEN